MRSSLLAVGLILTIAAITTPRGSRADGRLAVFVRSGSFHVLWGDGPTGAQQVPVKYFLVDDQGAWTELKPNDTSGSLLAFDRKRVRVVGEQISEVDGSVRIRELALEGPSTDSELPAIAVTGNKRWITILCRFADFPATTPRPPGYFDGLMGSVYPSLDHYWRESSYGSVYLTGSAVVGWYNLPRPRSYYVYGAPLRFDFNRAIEDVTAVSDADVYFPDFYGINFVFNQDLDGFSWGGSAAVSRDGLFNRVFGAAFLPPFAYDNQSRVAHEMGHGFGLPHSSGPYSATYDSEWDVMSGEGICSAPDSNYGCAGAHTISHHKDKLGWIPPSRKYVSAPGSSASIDIERLGQPLATNSYLMAQIPIDGLATRFYTVEARRFAGYDTQAPGQAIVIHDVDTTRGDRAARVVDPDNNGNPNDAGAMWLPGETFSDTAHNIAITVNSMGASSFRVTVTQGTQGPPALLTDETSGRAAALRSATFVRDPFSVLDLFNFGADQRTHLMLFARNVQLAPGEDASAVTAQVEIAGMAPIPLVVEFVGRVPNNDWLTQVTVTVPDSLAHAGDVQVSISFRGVTSNRVTIYIQ